MQYEKGKHCVFYHRYHVVWSTKYRFKVLRGDVQSRVREIIRRVCSENDVTIISGVVSSDHVHMFVSIPPKLSMSDFMRKVKGAKFTNQVHHLIMVVQWEETTASSILTSVLN